MINLSSLQPSGTQTESQKSTYSQTLGKDDFLTLLVTQLKNQDPMSPMDPTEFTAQLAQFSSLEQLYNVNENLQSLKSIQSGFERLSALSLIDKQVVSDASTFKYQGDPIALGFAFQEKVTEATVEIKTPDGQTLNKITVANPSAEEHFIQWDGTDIDGRQLPEGTYTLNIIGTTEEGKSISATSMVKSRITGVDFSGSETILMTNNGTVKLSDISKVNNSTSNDDL